MAKNKKVKITVSKSYLLLEGKTLRGKTKDFWVGSDHFACVRRAMRESKKLRGGAIKKVRC